MEWIDIARGLAILLVVFGHVVAGVLNAGISGSATDNLRDINRFVYTFHMPVFLIAAGIFATRAIQKPAPVFWGDKFGSIVYPYVIWSIVQTATHIAFSAHSNTAASWTDFARIAYEPLMQFWFLYNLFLWFVLYRVVSRAGGGHSCSSLPPLQ